MTYRLGLILALLLTGAPAARGKASLDVQVGWEGAVRMGRWTPVQVTLSDPDGANAVVEISAAHDQIFSMRVRQFVGGLTPQPKTFVLYVPLNGYVGWGLASSLSVVVRDAGSGKVLTHTRDDDPNAFNSIQQVEAQGQFIGTSGRRSSLNNLRSAIGSQLLVGHLPLEMLPGTPAGYDALDLLLLNEADVGALSSEQQQALLDWVRAGGHLLYWPGTDPLPDKGPLIDALPCHVGGATVIPLPSGVLRDFDLPSRFAKLPARLLDPTGREGVRTIPLLRGKAAAYQTDIGLGRITVSPVNIDALTPPGPAGALEVWKPVLEGSLDLTVRKGSTPAGAIYPGYSLSETDQSTAESAVAERLGNVPGAGQFGFSYVAIALVGLMLIVGPVDWLVLRALKRQAWTWVTTSGWIGLVTFGALYTGHAFKSGDLHYRTCTLVDQAGSGAVARTEFVGLYSPRTTRYTFETSPNGWWEPLSASQYFYAQRTGSELPFQQTYHGNTPLPMLANVWSLRFQKGQEWVAGPKLLDADLKRDNSSPSRITGTIHNLTERPLRNVRVLVHGWSTPVMETLSVPANGSAALDGLLSVSRKRETDQNVSPGMVHESEISIDSPTALISTADGLAAARAERFKQRLESGSYALVIAEQDGSAPMTTLSGQDTAVQQHVRVIRALVPLRTAK